jgi:hypothetical protein
LGTICLGWFWTSILPISASPSSKDYRHEPLALSWPIKNLNCSLSGSSLFFILKFHFTFKLAYIDRVRGFYCDNSINGYSVLWTSSPLPYISLAPFSKCLVGFIM